MQGIEPGISRFRCLTISRFRISPHARTVRNDQIKIGARSRRDQSAGGRVPPPKAIVGQFGAAPPAMDRVAPAEIFSPRQNSLAERGELQLALSVSLMTIAVL